MFWIAIALFLLATILLLARPFYGVSTSDNDKQMQELLDSLESIKQDKKNQTISNAEAKALTKTTAERILLLQQNPQISNSPTRADRTIFISLAALVIFSTLGLYLLVGDVRFVSGNVIAPKVTNNAPTPQNLENAVEKLTAYLKDNPDDMKNWQLLGWSFHQLNNFEASKSAYQKALALAPNNPQTLAAFGETLTSEANGIITEKALAAFTKSLEFDPANVRANFYLGMAKQQSGDDAGALETWVNLLQIGPANAIWRADLIVRVNNLSQKLGTTLPGDLTQARLKGPNAEDVANAAQMSPEQRQQMIQGMVEQLQLRLSQNPNDLSGWKQLIRSQIVMGQTEQAEASLMQANAIFKDNATATTELAQLAKDQGITE